MEHYLPTYEECMAIVEKYDGLQFYESVQEVDGYKISTFNYRMVWYDDFVIPLGEDSPVKAFELRGLCFVFNTDGSLYRRFLLMNKFFNINQVESTQYDLIKDLKFKSVYNKEDGSVINFIELPNGRILSKSKMQVDNVQAVAAYRIYEANESIQKLVKWALSNDIMPIFEYVSPLNRVVLKYSESDLVLLRLRCLNTGQYLDFETYPNIDDVNVVQKISIYNGFPEILKDYETLENIEGCVVELEDNPHAEFVKVKTEWYFIKHQLYDNLHREDKIIKMILEETIDDHISTLDIEYDHEIINMIENISAILNSFIQKKTITVEKISNKYKGSIKEFAIEYKHNTDFHLSIKHINGEDLFDIIKCYIIKNTNKLNKAILFIERNGENLL